MARVLVLTVAHPPEDARIRHREIGALVEHGHEVTYVAPFAAFGATPPPDLRTIDVPRSQGSPVVRARAVRAAARVLAQEASRHDVVLVHDPELLPALAVARLRGGRPGPVLVWDVHEDVPAQMYMLDLPRPVQRVGAGAIGTAERVAEHGIRLLLAEYDYQDRFRHEHPVVPNTVLVPEEPPGPAEEHPRVVYLGALTRARGSDELVAVAERLPGVTFDVLGNASPSVHDDLGRAAQRLDNLRYHGFVPNTEALHRLRGALAGLAMLHPHRNYEQSRPTKVMEYMAHGVPTVTTPNEASAQMVLEADAGAVIGFGDVEGAVAAIRGWDADRTEQHRLALNAYATAREQYSWQRDGARFAEVIGQWAAARSSRRR